MKRKWLFTLLTVAMVSTNMLSGYTVKTVSAAEAENENAAETDTEEENAAESETDTVTATEGKTLCEEGREWLYGLNERECDLEKAYARFQEAAEDGYQDAWFYLGLMTDGYAYPIRDMEKAMEYYKLAGENPYAQINMGCLYLFGQGVEADSEKALDMFQQVVDSGCETGNIGFGWYWNGREEYDKAWDFYEKVVDEEQEPFFKNNAKELMTSMIFYGQGREVDDKLALAQYEELMETNDPYAYGMVGLIYRMGYGVDVDKDKALETFEEGRRLHDVDSIKYLGEMYWYGDGVEQDIDKAIAYYEEAGRLGDPEAYRIVGDNYASGAGGVEADSEKAKEWYEKAGDTTFENEAVEGEDKS
ncbi:MAG: tetratricopeptide repeat protein [Eubacteriales bacterium]|nr:tetratricopeptide repeat protein [Eubacteriales bacterium]